jgi:hypothetical protein
MTERIYELTGITPAMLGTMVGVSLFVFLGTLVAIPFILVRLPDDYFDLRVPRHFMEGSHPAIRVVAKVIRNIVGVAFLLAGLAMLLLPGQGVLTLLIGISLTDFPGKRRLEAKIIGQPKVFGAVNSLRAKFGKPPFVLASKEIREFT